MMIILVTTIPIDVTLFGIVAYVRFPQLANAYIPYDSYRLIT